MTATLIDGKPDWEYHNDIALPDGFGPPVLSTSMMDDFISHSPAKVKYELNKRDRILAEQGPAALMAMRLEEQTEAAARGSAMHVIVLRDNDIGAVMDVHDVKAWQSKDDKALRQESWDNGKIAVKMKDWEKWQDAVASFRQYPVASQIRIPGTLIEASIYHTDPHGVQKRVRVDMLPPREALAQGVGQIDYKTTELPFDRYIANFIKGNTLRMFNYTQAIMALHNLMPNYWLLVQQTNPPFSVQLVCFNFGSAFAHPSMTNTGLEPGIELPPHGDIAEADALNLVALYKEGELLANAASPFWKHCVENDWFPHPEDIAIPQITNRDLVAISQKYSLLARVDQDKYEYKTSNQRYEKGAAQ